MGFLNNLTELKKMTKIWAHKKKLRMIILYDTLRSSWQNLKMSWVDCLVQMSIRIRSHPSMRLAVKFLGIGKKSGGRGEGPFGCRKGMQIQNFVKRFPMEGK